jgi:hypothetical protein
VHRYGRKGTGTGTYVGNNKLLVISGFRIKKLWNNFYKKTFWSRYINNRQLSRRLKPTEAILPQRRGKGLGRRPQQQTPKRRRRRRRRMFSWKLVLTG